MLASFFFFFLFFFFFFLHMATWQPGSYHFVQAELCC